jgi:FdrA protein
MAIIKVEIRSGAYYDSVILMKLQRSLNELPGVQDAGVVMGTAANKDVLAQSGLLVPEAIAAKADDAVIVIKADDEPAAFAALQKIDGLLKSRQSGGTEVDYRPKTLESASQMLPDAQWVLISVAGRYAAGVARQALELGKHVFLYSDNVSLEDEISLKKLSAEKGLLVMGPDCGTAIVNGFGLGFANQVRHGPIGMVAASGTGLQQVSARIHQMGGGFTHALGTGGRDLSEAVNAATFRQGLDFLKNDPSTQVIVLVSKPPSPKVAGELVTAARSAGKPVVVDFIGYSTAARVVDEVYFASSFEETAELAVQLASKKITPALKEDLNLQRFIKGQCYLRGLFSGGTLAYEALLILQDYLPAVYSNAPLKKELRLSDSLVSQEHTIIDLGEDEFTVGRLHPMMDNDLRIRRLEKEAGDPEVAIIFLDVVLGYGAHPNPASELAPAIKKAKAQAEKEGRYLEVVAIVCGTDGDPQGLESQIKLLKDAGAWVETNNTAAVRYAGRLVQALNTPPGPAGKVPAKSIDPKTLNQPLVAINVGLESFMESLATQEAKVIHVDWRPAAGGNEKLMSILERMKSKSG